MKVSVSNILSGVIAVVLAELTTRFLLGFLLPTETITSYQEASGILLFAGLYPFVVLALTIIYYLLFKKYLLPRINIH